MNVADRENRGTKSGIDTAKSETIQKLGDRDPQSTTGELVPWLFHGGGARQGDSLRGRIKGIKKSNSELRA